MKVELHLLFHNVIVHPFVGVLWFLSYVLGSKDMAEWARQIHDDSFPFVVKEVVRQ